MDAQPLLDVAGRPRSPATLPGYHAGRPPRNKGHRYPADPPTVEEIIAVMRAASERPPGLRLRTDRRPVAGRASDQRGARAHRGRSRIQPRIARRAPRQGRAPTRGRDGRMGLGPASALARAPGGASNRAALLHPQRPDGGRSLDSDLGPRSAPTPRCLRRGASALRTPSAPPRPRGRDGPRGGAAERDPAPARAQRPGRHVGLSRGDQQRRGDQCCSRAQAPMMPASAGLRFGA